MSRGYLNRNSNLNSNNSNLLNSNDDGRMAFLLARKMKSYHNLYDEIISLKNLISAERKARKGKSNKKYVKEFEKNIAYNLKVLHDELKDQTYQPQPLKNFILRDPKTRIISKSIFRDRIVHHALCNITEPLFENKFIYDSCANRKNKGTLFAIRRFELFQRKITSNLSKEAFCLKADIKHYFREVNREILFKILCKTLQCKKTRTLIEKILNNFEGKLGMPLGNLTSQFFANIYLNELDQFIKNELRVKFYIRYVDDFVILHTSRYQLHIWKNEVAYHLNNKLNITMHVEKSKIISLSRGIDFLGFRFFYYHKIPRKRNINSFVKNFRKMEKDYYLGILPKEKFCEKLEGWFAYVSMGNTYNLRKNLLNEISCSLK